MVGTDVLFLATNKDDARFLVSVRIQLGDPPGAVQRSADRSASRLGEVDFYGMCVCKAVGARSVGEGVAEGQPLDRNDRGVPARTVRMRGAIKQASLPSRTPYSGRRGAMSHARSVDAVSIAGIDRGGDRLDRPIHRRRVTACANAPTIADEYGSRRPTRDSLSPRRGWARSR